MLEKDDIRRGSIPSVGHCTKKKNNEKKLGESRQGLTCRRHKTREQKQRLKCSQKDNFTSLPHQRCRCDCVKVEEQRSGKSSPEIGEGVLKRRPATKNTTANKLEISFKIVRKKKQRRKTFRDQKEQKNGNTHQRMLVQPQTRKRPRCQTWPGVNRGNLNDILRGASLLGTLIPGHLR